ncbi:hypothetical protein BpHYR1_010117 [Brachionus plicatilis]|uniref:Uncharacterized protein n=1 Tax=Brachionus plicatilis TaxID=10195 RepID=A0A3M7PR04_BRAPC|nr:hypothetical protein BpHYR1_010117 [Brachionus plicatilis]
MEGSSLPLTWSRSARRFTVKWRRVLRPRAHTFRSWMPKKQSMSPNHLFIKSNMIERPCDMLKLSISWDQLEKIWCPLGHNCAALASTRQIPHGLADLFGCQRANESEQFFVEVKHSVLDDGIDHGHHYFFQLMHYFQLSFHHTQNALHSAENAHGSDGLVVLDISVLLLLGALHYAQKCLGQVLHNVDRKRGYLILVDVDEALSLTAGLSSFSSSLMSSFRAQQASTLTGKHESFRMRCLTQLHAFSRFSCDLNSTRANCLRTQQARALKKPCWLMNSGNT